MAQLEELRREIDKVDREIVQLFEKRMEIVSDISDYKIKNNLPTYDSLREEKLINKNIEYLKDKDLEEYLRNFYIHLLKLSKDYQDKKRK